MAAVLPIEPERLANVSFGLNNFIARETSPMSRPHSRPGSRKGSVVEGYMAVPATGQWTPPSVKSPSAVEQRKTPARDLFDPARTMSPTPTTPQMSRFREAGLPRRKRININDLGLGPMTTVQEAALDSPTIPGLTPGRTRPRHIAEVAQRAKTSPNEGGLTPRPLLVKGSSETNVQSPEALKRAERRASSMLLPHGLAPLLIPSNEHNSSIQAWRPSPSEINDDRPPQVPPKSPRYAAKASPQTKQSPSSASTCTSAQTSAISTVSSATSVSLNEDRASPKPWTAPLRADSLLTHHRNYSAFDLRSPPMPWSMKEWNGSASQRRRAESPVVDDIVPKLITTPTTDSQSGHQRVNSEQSVLHRGRPMKRGDMSLQRTLSKAKKKDSTSVGPSKKLPVGVEAANAANAISDEELWMLKKQANEQVKHFEILHHSDVSTLSQELQILDERCEYLRKTHNSLREGRRSLHTRMVAYLKSPQVARFSYENMLKQEETLTDLDTSIDDWMTRLEQTEARRAQIRQKLLEHVAAALTLDFSQRRPSQSVHSEQTPPRSPTEKADRSFSTERRDVESIKVYADLGVAALLADIQQEIGMMEACPGLA